MKLLGILESLGQRKWNVGKKFSQMTLALMTFLLWISPGHGDDKPPDCTARDLGFCTSPCAYLKDKCGGSRECALDLCSYLYPHLPPDDLERCWDLPSECELRFARKRGILNKNVAYLLLKLHPFFNQTSQFGFLTSGRFRRITGNFGTEFLGKRSNNKPSGSRPPGETARNLPKPKFYSLPLDKLAKSKVLKRDDFPLDFPDSREKRLSVRGNGRVIHLGSEFLGKRAYDRVRRLEGTEFLGKRNDDPFDGSEFLGKRMADSLADGGAPRKRQQEPVTGTELLGKKSSQNSSLQVKRYGGNELLGKRVTGNSGGGFDPGFDFQHDSYPELLDETFSGYESLLNSRFPFGSHLCRDNDSRICGKYKDK